MSPFSVMKETKFLTIGNNQVALSDFQNQANSKLQDYLSSSNMSDSRKQEFTKSYQNVMDSINNGNISVRDNSRRWIDKSGAISNNPNSKQDLNGEVAYFLDSVADTMSPYKEPDKTPYGISDFGEFWKNKYFGGQNPTDVGFSWQNQGTQNGKFNKNNNANYLKGVLGSYLTSLNDEKYNNYDFSKAGYKDVGDLKTKLQGVISRLSDNTINQQDYDSLRSIGLNPNDIFSNAPKVAAPVVAPKTDTPTDTPPATSPSKLFIDPNQALDKDKYNQIKAQDPALAEQYKNEIVAEAKEANQNLLSNFRNSLNVAATRRFNQGYVNKLIKGETDLQNTYLPLASGYTSRNFIADLHNPASADKASAYATNAIKNFNTTGTPSQSLITVLNGLTHFKYQGKSFDTNTLRKLVVPLTGDRASEYYIRGSYDKVHNTVKTYNSTNNSFKEVPIKYLPSVQKYLLSHNMKDILGYKQGGILKAQKGISFAQAVKQQDLQWGGIQQKQQVTQAQQHTRPLSQGLTWEDKVRLGSVAADLGSTIAAMVPGGGTLASAALGGTSSLGNFAADLGEGQGLWSASKNLGTNLVLDTIGLIPGIGIEGKLGKVAKWIPKLFQTAALSGLITNSKELTASVNKLTTGDFKNITTGDLNNYLYITNTVAGVTRGVGAHMQQKKIKGLATTSSMDLKGNNGLSTLTAEQAAELRTKSTAPEANNYLKSIGINNTVNDGFKPNSGSILKPFSNYSFGHNPQMSTHYDYSLLPSKYNNISYNIQKNVLNSTSLTDNPLQGIKTRRVSPIVQPVSEPVTKPTATFDNSPLFKNEKPYPFDISKTGTDLADNIIKQPQPHIDEVIPNYNGGIYDDYATFKDGGKVEYLKHLKYANKN